MNKYLKITFFLALTFFIASCDDDSTSSVSPLVEKAAMLTKGEATVGTVDIPEGSNVTDWEGFTITFKGDEAGGTYTTNADVAKLQTAVWATSGSWTFGDDTGSTIIRDGDLDNPMTATISEESVELEFSQSTPLGARIKVVAGDWGFPFNF